MIIPPLEKVKHRQTRHQFLASMSVVGFSLLNSGHESPNGCINIMPLSGCCLKFSNAKFMLFSMGITFID